jgi:antitoxin (DNA-binding transcriptional repressor) of toxin-antitoxin stability system
MGIYVWISRRTLLDRVLKLNPDKQLALGADCRKVGPRAGGLRLQGFSAAAVYCAQPQPGATMPMTNVEVYEAGKRMDELIETVMQGTEVTITHFGEPVAVVGMRRMAGETPADTLEETPPPWVKEAIAEMIDKALEQIRGRLDTPLWRLN